MNKVKAKKILGQHFLLDLNIAQETINLIKLTDESVPTFEIGPGMGVLTQFALERKDLDLYLVEIDKESVNYLRENFTLSEDHLIHDDFLQMTLEKIVPKPHKFNIVGNFPYNISSQIFFKVLDYTDQVDQVVCMLQKEVGKRIASKPGNKDYGILSVLLQAYYDINYDFSVGPEVFDPPPRVDSCVISLRRAWDRELECDPKKFKLVVKTAFNQRRKMLSNALRPISIKENLPYANKRAEQLGYEQFVELTNFIFGAQE